MNSKDQNIRIRVDKEEKQILEDKAREFGFVGLSEYLRFVGRNCKTIEIKVEKQEV